MAQRKHALDTVRFLALVGIVINHTLSNSSAQPLVNILQDYHAVIFVLLMGVFIDPHSNFRKVIIRSGVLIGTGFALGSSIISIDIILVQLGILNLIAWLILQKISKFTPLFILTIAWLLLSPILSQIIRAFLEQNLHIIPTQENIGLNLLLEDPISFILRPFFYSSYPVLQWITIILFGILFKNFLNSKWWKISVIGLAMFSLAKITSFMLGGSLWTMDNGTSNNWNTIFDSGAYTGTTLGMLSSVGVGFFIIGVVQFFDILFKWRINPYLSGSTLSLYSIHVFSFTMIPHYIFENTVHSFIVFTATLLFFAVFSFLWFCLSKNYGFSKYGPLEEFTHYLTVEKSSKT